jgi:antitoxin component HigA of HigAB toxin-antitoxin module
MQVRVRTPHTKIDIEGTVSKKLLRVLKEDFGDNVIIDDDTWIIAEEASWYKTTKKNMTPNDYMRIYRETRGLTQAALGDLLGGLSRQKISDIENGRRPVSKEIAKKLSEIFKTSAEKFI